MNSEIQTEGDTECPICLEPLNGKLSEIETSCHHRFHSNCLLKSIFTSEGNHLCCPKCRANVSDIVDGTQHTTTNTQHTDALSYNIDGLITIPNPQEPRVQYAVSNLSPNITYVPERTFSMASHNYNCTSVPTSSGVVRERISEYYASQPIESIC